MPRSNATLDDNGAAVARRFGVTIKTLRLYESLGLLTPTRTAAGWRVYGPGEVARLHTVLSLKQMGLPLASIALLVRERYPDMASLLALQEQALLTQRGELDHALALIRAARRRVASGEALDADDLANLVAETACCRLEWTPELQGLAEHVFTPGQLAELDARRPSLDEEAQVFAAWAQIFSDIDAFIAGEDPTSEPGLAIARRAVGLIKRFTRGDPNLWNASARFWRTGLDSPELKDGLPMREAHWNFLASAMGELQRRGELQP